MNFMLTTQSSYKPCEKCKLNNYEPQNRFCYVCRPKYRKVKCYKHTFSVLNMKDDRTIKCSSELCSETRKG